MQKGQSRGQLSSGIYSSRISGNDQIDDVTSGSMAAPPAVNKSRLWHRNRLHRKRTAFLSGSTLGKLNPVYNREIRQSNSVCLPGDDYSRLQE